jgi:DHA2 family methylenomycin A resistance protein-like MFS transporter
MQTTSLNTRQPEQARSDNTSSRSPLAAALALAATSLGLGVVQLDITIVNTALSSIRPRSPAAWPSCNGW